MLQAVIFKMFAEGQSMDKIVNYLTEREAPRRNGEKVWNRANVNLILRNEKYVGDAILQKTYTSDCLTHSRKVNNGKSGSISSVTATLRSLTGTHGIVCIWSLPDAVQK